MGKSSGKKKKKQSGEKTGDPNSRPSKSAENSPKKASYDKDTAVFIATAGELKEEGNKLFQRRDLEGAMLKYERALKLLPRNHVDVAYLRSNMAACYMQMGVGDYARAVHECTLALEVSPRYSKALIKRARCYEGLNRFELALRDINTVLSIEPNNLTALEIIERLKRTMEKQKKQIDDNSVLEIIEPPSASPSKKVVKAKRKKKKSAEMEKKEAEKVEIEVVDDENRKTRAGNKDEKKADDKVVVEEEFTDVKVDDQMKKTTVKLVFGQDIRLAHIPVNCNFLQMREIIEDRFPILKPILVKYKDHEGDMVTITNNEELKWAKESTSPHVSFRLHIVEVDPKQDPLYEKVAQKDSCTKSENGVVNGTAQKAKESPQKSPCIEPWIIKFAQLFKNYVGFSSDAYLDLHDVGVKLYSEAMEETVTSDEAQTLFDMAGQNFQEMTALALFNWGNVHMAQARRRVHFTEESSNESVIAQVKDAYEWAQKEYMVAGQRYEEALKIKPDFYEAHLALGHQQFEQAKLAWYYALANNVDLETWSYQEVLELYNKAEDNVEKGVQIWEELEQEEQNKLSRAGESKKTALDYHISNDIPPNEAAEQRLKIRSHINVLWGTMLYERSIMEYKLQVPVWQECLEVAMEKFELAGASPTEITVMLKNHCSNDAALEGLGFRIDEIVQAWNEMDEARMWYSGLPSFRMEPLLRQRVSKLYSALEHP